MCILRKSPCRNYSIIANLCILNCADCIHRRKLTQTFSNKLCWMILLISTLLKRSINIFRCLITFQPLAALYNSLSIAKRGRHHRTYIRNTVCAHIPPLCIHKITLKTVLNVNKLSSRSTETKNPWLLILLLSFFRFVFSFIGSASVLPCAIYKCERLYYIDAPVPEAADGLRIINYCEVDADEV